MSMTLIQTQTVGTTASSIDFTSIPQTYTDLLLVMSLRTNAINDYSSLAMRFNGSSANFEYRFLQGSGSTILNRNNILFGFIGDATTSTLTSNTFGSISVLIPNYFSSDTKLYSSDSVTENNATIAYQSTAAVSWNNSSPITSISVYEVDSNTFVANSTISLYGIRKGSGGASIS